MSGLLRRIKRSRPADAGEPLPEGQAAAPEGAAPATDPATAVTEPASPETPEPRPAKPVLLADPDTPAGVDPAAGPLRPPAGRRGRLRRRLRYLRRARELMLRDLGGLLYEVHRTGGGNVEAHGNIIHAKVQRIAGLDAEAHALETALSTPRAEPVVFQPGVGGSCPSCGELYSSAARFCSNCATPLGAAIPVPVADPTPAPAPATRESVFGRPASPTTDDPLREHAPAPDQPTADLGATPPATGDETAVIEPAGDEPAASDEPAAPEPAAPEPAATEPAATDDTAVTEAGASEETGETPGTAGAGSEGDATGRNPFSRLENGRPAEDHSPPELSSGDPLVTRDTGS